MIPRKKAVAWVWLGVIVLIVLRQDHWFWDDPRLVGGILPVGLAWHVGISLAAAALWLWTAFAAWPEDLPDPPARDERQTDTASPEAGR